MILRIFSLIIIKLIVTAFIVDMLLYKSFHFVVWSYILIMFIWGYLRRKSYKEQTKTLYGRAPLALYIVFSYKFSRTYLIIVLKIISFYKGNSETQKSMFYFIFPWLKNRIKISENVYISLNVYISSDRLTCFYWTVTLIMKRSILFKQIVIN